MSTAPVLPTLVAKWSTKLLSCADSFGEEEKRKEKEQVAEQKEEDELCTLRASVAQLCGDDWKQRGQGEAKLLRCFSSGEVWFVMRDEQSTKTIAQFRVDDVCDLDTTCNSGRSLFCSAAVVRNGERSYVFFSLRFASKEVTLKFKGRRSCGGAVVLAERASGTRCLASPGPFLPLLYYSSSPSSLTVRVRCLVVTWWYRRLVSLGDDLWSVPVFSLAGQWIHARQFTETFWRNRFLREGGFLCILRGITS